MYKKSVMHVQSCCYANTNLLLFCLRRRRCLSSLLLWSRNIATMVTWRHTSLLCRSPRHRLCHWHYVKPLTKTFSLWLHGAFPIFEMSSNIHIYKPSLSNLAALTLRIPISTNIFSGLTSIPYLENWFWEFVWKFKYPSVYHLLIYSHQGIYILIT